MTGGGVELAALSRLGVSGSIEIDERGQDIDWLTARVQHVYDPGVEGVEPWPVATMRFTSPRDRHTSFGVSYSVELLSKLSILDSASPGAFYSLAEGTRIIDTVVSLIQSTGEKRIAVTPSDKTLPNQMVFDPASTILTIINELLKAAGYWSLWVDGAGVYRVEPYEDPSQRPESHRFENGDAQVRFPDWEREQDLSNVPNVYRVYREGSDEDDGIEGVYRNEDEESPFSIPRRGFIIERSESAEVETVEEAVELATRRLRDAMSVVGRITASHAPLPLNPNEVIRHIDGTTDVRCTIQSMSLSFETGTECRAEWREVTA
ncbi:hypothetical protein D3229_09915 [Leucobacter aridicollis]|nr:hypothetical protein [Leucobacter aridicollis]